MNHTQDLTEQMDIELDPLDNFVRVPGLLRRWEIEQVVTSGAEYHIEDAGETSDKTQVFAVYRREYGSGHRDTHHGIGVGLMIDNQLVTLRARLRRLHGSERLMAILVVGDNPEDAAVLARVREHLARSGEPTRHAADRRRNATKVAQESATP